jgi:anti-sigma B factor antagonist
MLEELTLATELRGRAAIVRVGGALDIRFAERLDRELARLIDRRTSDIIVDLRGIEFMDSIGLRSLVAAHQTAWRARVPMWFVRGGTPVTRVLRMTGLDAVLPLIDRLPRRLEHPPGRAPAPPAPLPTEVTHASP